MNSQTPRPITKKSWFSIFFVLCGSVLTYGLLCYLITHNPDAKRSAMPDPTTMRPILIAAGVAALVVSLAWMRLRIDGKIGGEGRPVALSPQEFQTESIIALALAEGCSIFGLQLFFMGAPMSEFAVFGFGTLFVDFAFILPRGIQFWSTQK
ncbi:hypothetical protein B1R32_1074 [Abditibacterium utsteinense]|uniref:Uncharacterized protein n=1 Tax=Abditibacterium utsteinense TaxID=1960156 RepID=A0A2S8ST54_9BACT|nr:hypothetical protein [Abditibacterium utsteinense]PQV63982.1 hypothetical protein B1R32_1074 [Abditibacterium utsteinense]